MKRIEVVTHPSNSKSKLVVEIDSRAPDGMVSNVTILGKHVNTYAGGKPVIVPPGHWAITDEVAPTNPLAKNPRNVEYSTPTTHVFKVGPKLGAGLAEAIKRRKNAEIEARNALIKARERKRNQALGLIREFTRAEKRENLPAYKGKWPFYASKK